MDLPFYYLGAGYFVPDDVAYVIVDGSVTVVPPGAFEGRTNLTRVDFQEGVAAIGRRTFANCPNLTTVGWASSLRAIGKEAFAWCQRLSESMLRQGLEEIGYGAFEGCGLRRIAVPSSVVEIGARAFASCHGLSEANLPEGLEKIGHGAFYHCPLERIAVPSSVVEIGGDAFCDCRWLSEVTLAGGMVTLRRSAFRRCCRLERIAVSSMAIVVEAGKDGSARTAAVTGGIQRPPTGESESRKLIMASPHMALIRPGELRRLTYAIHRIADTTRGAGPLDLRDEDVSGRIRERFVDRRSTWHGRYKREAAAVLELALWKAALGRATGRVGTAGADVLTRDDCRCTCGVDPIVRLVLPFL